MLSRRQIVSAAAVAAIPLLPWRTGAVAMAPLPQGWRRFEVTTILNLPASPGPAQAWLPLAAFGDPAWIVPEANDWTVAPGAVAARLPGSGLLHIVWGEGVPRRATVTSRVATRDRAKDWRKAADAAPLGAAARALYLAPTREAPAGGIVAATAAGITQGAARDIDKARALYDWVVAHTFRDPATPGCGEGAVAALLQSGRLGGKCADINGLMVALARASGIPARDLYGIRVAPSRLGYASLGAATPLVTKAQHCRAELYLDGFGWTAVDPADVRKVMLEEAPGGLPADDSKVAAARQRLFGNWEGNWIAFNADNDLVLPGRAGTAAFLMYPQVETAAGRLDCYHPDQVAYRIQAREVAI